jgi:hypothetical protein
MEGPVSLLKEYTALLPGISERRAKPMSVMDFITITGFGLTCFVLGYTLGKDIFKTQK